MENTKQGRLLELFFRSLHGEALSVQKLADEYEVSTKSVTRTLNDLKAFLAENRELVGNTEYIYSYTDKCYHLHMDGFLSNKELFSIVEVILGTRAFSKIELLELVDKLKRLTTPEDRSMMEELIRKEIYHYTEVAHDCESVQDNLWQVVNCITEKKDITIDYYRMDRAYLTYDLCPATVMFADHYFYLIAFENGKNEHPLYFRVDRIRHITVHRKSKSHEEIPAFDEGLLRRRSLFMWPGKLRTIRFEFTGPSVQAVLDKLPTAKVLEHYDGKYLIEAEVYGEGIKMWLLSQGKWVKVTSPAEFVQEMKEEIKTMSELYK